MQYAILDLETNTVVERGNLPIRRFLPDGGFAEFSEVGQTLPEHTPRFQVIGSVIVTPEPDIPVTVESETSQIVDDREEITRIYAPDLEAYRALVNAERDRRIHGGFVFNGTRFQSRVEDQKRIAGAGTLAVITLTNGAEAGDYRWHGGDTDFVWIAEDNTLVQMDAQTVIAFGQAAARHESAHVFAARVLKDADPVVDFADSKYWPATA